MTNSTSHDEITFREETNENGTFLIASTGEVTRISLPGGQLMNPKIVETWRQAITDRHSDKRPLSQDEFSAFLKDMTGEAPVVTDFHDHQLPAHKGPEPMNNVSSATIGSNGSGPKAQIKPTVRSYTMKDFKTRTEKHPDPNEENNVGASH